MFLWFLLCFFNWPEGHFHTKSSRTLISFTKLRKKEIQRSRFAKKKVLDIEKKKKKGARDYEMNILY